MKENQNKQFMGRHGLKGVIEKPKDFKKTFKKIINYFKSYNKIIIFSLLLAIISTLFQIIGPDKLKDMTNEIALGLPKLIDGKPFLSNINMDNIKSIGLILLILYVGSAILTFIQNFIMATITQKISKSMRTDIHNKINKLPLKYYDNTSYGDILSRIVNDVDTIAHTMNQSIGSLIVSITMLIGSLIMMFYNNWILSLVSIGSSMMGLIIMLLILSKSQKFFKEQQTNLGNINGYIEEVYSGHNIIKAYNAEEKSIKEFNKINDKLYNSAWKSQFLSGMMVPVMNFVSNFGYVMVCIVGASLVLKGTISFGVIIAFIMYVRLFTQPLSQIAQATNNLQRSVAASERVFEFLEEQELEDESNKTLKLENVKGDIEFDNINFGYDSNKLVIKNFSAKVKKGQKVAIVGPTGAGKTTLVNLLMRFYELNDGKITIDNISIRDVRRENVQNQFCMVLQDTWLFEASIKDNIIFNKKDITENDVIKACKTVNLHHFINTLPNGYNTIIDEKYGLSEGQKQLLTIARAIIQDAPLLILDEATSSVDTRTEKLVQSAIDKLMKGRTTFVIAHRLSTIKNADIIFVIENGNIVESGNHEELLNNKGSYYNLYNSQFSNNMI